MFVFACKYSAIYGGGLQQDLEDRWKGEGDILKFYMLLYIFGF